MLERFEEALHKQENPTDEKPYEPTLKDILKSKEDSDLFGELLKRENMGDLGNRVAKGELNESDIQELDVQRKDFLGTMEQVKTIKESISDKTIQMYARNSPDLQKAMSLIGKDAYRDIVKEKIERLSITDPDAFNAIHRAVENENNYKEDQHKDLDTRITELCKQKDVDGGKYMEALTIEDETERDAALREVVRGGYGSIRKAFDWMTKGGLSKKSRANLEEQRQYIQNDAQNMRYFQSEVGSFLFALTDNESIREALSKQLIGERSEKQKSEGFSEMKNATRPTPESLQTAWAAFKKEKDGEGDEKWDMLTPERQDNARDDFLRQQKEMYEATAPKSTSFWSSIFGAMFDLFDSFNKAELK